ncbi:spore cortex-lytic protein [Pseudoflavonifractor sp. 524-17]|uniref:spore cortex-lytic protein n=1 Tax=Pseudoflavonifractor sp. 524-17 TaxID=2304577 RepID=UPI001FAE1326|nr:spore cortex-lytic protein [Pseudoflavonifractor sp. 524-17]
MGSIVTYVYTSYARLPIQGATVAFTQNCADGRQTLLAVRVTDDSGKTAPVRLATPALSQSTSPGTQTPYALCNIWTEASGYECSIIGDVRVFPGIVSTQDIELVPVPLAAAEEEPCDDDAPQPQ